MRFGSCSGSLVLRLGMSSLICYPSRLGTFRRFGMFRVLIFVGKAISSSGICGDFDSSGITCAFSSSYFYSFIRGCAVAEAALGT